VSDPVKQPKRAAVVIGVDRTGGLPPLSGAAKGARDVGCWLSKNGYAVTPLTDADGGRVTFTAVFDAVQSYLKQGGLDCLVIYFAGHGYFSVGTEIWLLSGAPANASEAIHLEQSRIAASNGSGLKNVVFIADTCRSVPVTVEANAVRGGSIFPMRPLSTQTDVDTLYATLPGDVAVEVAEDAARRNYNGLFTTVLTQLYAEGVAADQLATVEGESGPITVLPNRNLRKLLPPRFAAEVQRLRVLISQTPALKIESDVPFYIAPTHAKADPAIAERGGIFLEARVEGGGKTDGLFAAARSLIERGSIPEAPMIASLGDDRKALQFKSEAREHRDAQPEGGFETQCGVLLTGSSIVEAVAIGKVFAEVECPGQADNRVRIQREAGDYGPNPNYGAVAIRLAEGTGTILAAIPGYIAGLVVREGGVDGVSYSPAPNSPQWAGYAYTRALAEERRAIAATAARHGILAMDREEARQFADLVRVGKGFDPTLGIYAALAYANVGLSGDALSVLHYMQLDLSANLLDVWLFAGADPRERDRFPLLPPCPMLSQGWDYCAPLGFALPPVLAGATRRQTLWTTFAPEAMDAIMAAAKRGDLG
jgi:hypothetical protein